MPLAGILPYNHPNDMSAPGHGQAARRSVCDHHSAHTKCLDDTAAISEQGLKLLIRQHKGEVHTHSKPDLMGNFTFFKILFY